MGAERRRKKKKKKKKTGGGGGGGGEEEDVLSFGVFFVRTSSSSGSGVVSTTNSRDDVFVVVDAMTRTQKKREKRRRWSKTGTTRTKSTSSSSSSSSSSSNERTAPAFGETRGRENQKGRTPRRRTTPTLDSSLSKATRVTTRQMKEMSTLQAKCFFTPILGPNSPLDQLSMLLFQGDVYDTLMEKFKYVEQDRFAPLAVTRKIG